MKNLDMRRKPFSVDSVEFRHEFDFIAQRFLRSLCSNSIRGFLCTVGHESCSIFAVSVLNYFLSTGKNSLILPYYCKFEGKNELHPFVAYTRHGGFILNFRNHYGIFVSVTVYIDGSCSVHFLK